MGKLAVAPIKLVARLPDEPGEYVADRRMTFEEYLELDHERGLAEWIDGEVHFYVGASTAHQTIILFLASLLEGYLQATGEGRAFMAPLVVRTEVPRRGREPDIMVVLAGHASRIRSTYVDGPPDIVIEVVSDESAARDYETKRTEYAQAGVPEYWVIDPRGQRVEGLFLSLAGEGYEIIPVTEGMVRSRVLPGFWLQMSWLQEERPSAFRRLREILGERAN